MGDYIKFPKVITVSSVAIDMLKTGNECKITQVFVAIDDTHIFIKTYLVKAFQHKKKLQQKFIFSKSNSGSRIWDNKSEMEMFISNA